ncbi:MAG: CrcB family protein [Proteobacteria bacterium]|jgi:CrcB protein|nr:CrcB family protein [Pseudomonadota bacterium]
MNWLFVALGGAIGTLARYGAFRAWERLAPTMPLFWGTLIVNIIGCFAIGCIYSYSIAQVSSDNFKLFWMVGILGGFTTFSAFGLDIFQMVQHRSLLFTAGYFLFHGIICVLMVHMGYTLLQHR